MLIPFTFQLSWLTDRYVNICDLFYSALKSSRADDLKIVAVCASKEKIKRNWGESNFKNSVIEIEFDNREVVYIRKLISVKWLRSIYEVERKNM